MRYTLEGCAHWKVKSYDYGQGTCLLCYRRVKATEGAWGVVWVPDSPTWMCNHPNKTFITDTAMTDPERFDAMCTDCGSILRRQDDAWREVIFNGFLIREEPFV